MHDEYGNYNIHVLEHALQSVLGDGEVRLNNGAVTAGADPLEGGCSAFVCCNGRHYTALRMLRGSSHWLKLDSAADGVAVVTEQEARRVLCTATGHLQLGGELAAESAGVYFERQDAAHCGVHACNNALGRQQFTIDAMQATAVACERTIADLLNDV